MRYATKTQIHFCRTQIEAIDKANLIYISNPLANKLIHEKQDKTIEILRETANKIEYIAILTY